ncbi:MAG TPA: lipid A deacylase LpxR family protein, partial [Archangium sp.]|nr:lipid A deacylase LpxR family protein [Archangium sp.]
MNRLLLTCALLLATSATAQAPEARCTVRMHVENDVVTRTDRHYTNGLRFDSMGCGAVPLWDRAVGSFADLVRATPLDAVATGFTIGNNMYTPTHYAATGFDPNERPFAGWLYLGGLGSVWRGRDRYDVELDIGVTGPPALSGEFQGEWHKLLGKREFENWHNQVSFSPVVRLALSAEQELWQWPRPPQPGILESTTGRWFTLTLRSRVELGNLFDTASTGPLLRLGWIRDGSSLAENIPSILAERPLFWEAFLYARASVKLVLFNALISGPPLTRSVYTAASTPLVTEGDAGLAFSVGPFSFGAGVVLR